jgi:nucleotide-binding universal stress UspA family protein
VHIALGTPASEVLRYADGHDPALIVMGLRRHGVMDRMLGDETTLSVARRARTPVLGVVPGLRGLPRNAVVGVDFGPASVRAARAALDVLATASPVAPTTLHLVYVNASVADESREETGEALVHRLGVTAAFEQLVRELDAPPGMTVACTVRTGEAGPELLALASELRADLIAVGSLRHERLERWILGSVTTQVVRDGRCSVLVIPPAHTG